MCMCIACIVVKMSGNKKNVLKHQSLHAWIMGTHSIIFIIIIIILFIHSKHSQNEFFKPVSYCIGVTGAHFL